ncbi:MAG TPA: BON domain-containing protein [Blastocatellia bacterium]|nr:BON domain-containing protein [Blastocatellia bacterium]
MKLPLANSLQSAIRNPQSAIRSPEETLNEVRAALEREPRIRFDQRPIQIAFNKVDDTVTLQGEAPDVAAKKLAMELAASAPGVRGVVDRLRVAPGERMSDEEIRNHILDAFIQEPAFGNCAIRVQTNEGSKTFNDPAEKRGDMLIIVGGGMALQEGRDEGVVLLEGQAPSLSHKRLAGALAWWAPGSRDVLNCLEVVPPEEDNDDEITDAVKLVMDKDPFVDDVQVLVATRDRVVTLEGAVRSEGEKDMAESDAWFIFGVDKVINNLQVV